MKSPAKNRVALSTDVNELFHAAKNCCGKFISASEKTCAHATKIIPVVTGRKVLKAALTSGLSWNFAKNFAWKSRLGMTKSFPFHWSPNKAIHYYLLFGAQGQSMYSLWVVV